MADAIPLNPNEPIVCARCDGEFTPRTAHDAVQFGDFWFCSAECERHWNFYGGKCSI